jgi:outer membrane protein, heavy metal efflux system
MRTVRWGHAAALVGVTMLIASRACAADQLTLAELLRVARTDNPEIRAAAAQYQAMRQRPVQEGTLPDPTVGVRYHNERWDRITFGESDFSFVEFSAEQEVPFPGKLGLRARMADREAEREGAMRDVTTLMVLARVASSYADLAVVDRARALLADSQRALDMMVEQANTAYGVGRAAQQDVLRGTLEREVLVERLTMLAQKRAAAQANINALLARPPEAEVPPTTWSDASATLPPSEVLRKRLADAAPELRAARENVLRSAAALDLARREYLPDFAFMAGYSNKNGLFPEWEVGMRINVPLYFWRRQQPRVVEATYARTAAEESQRKVRSTLEGRLGEVASMGEAAARLVRLYRDRLVPQASLTLDSARASYTVGKVDFLTVLTAFTALLEYRIRQVEEVGNLQRARAEIAPLIGEPPPEEWGK